MSELRTRIAEVIERHRNLQPDDLRDLFTQRCACGLVLTGITLDALGEAWTVHLADRLADLLIDMAGHGELLKAIDRTHR